MWLRTLLLVLSSFNLFITPPQKNYPQKPTQLREGLGKMIDTLLKIQE